MKKYKYIHLFWFNELKFSGSIVRMINNIDNGFNLDDHLFVTFFEEVYSELNNYPNVLLVEKQPEADVLKTFEPWCDRLFSHGLTESKFQSLMIRRKIIQKVIWRTWGGGRQKSRWSFVHPISIIKTKIGDIAYFLYMKSVFGRSCAVGIANIVDRIDIGQWGWISQEKLFLLSYPIEGLDEIVREIESKGLIHRDNMKRIIVGHQANRGENHLEIVKKLLRYRDPSLRIYIPLSYGNLDYMRELKEQLNELNDSRIVIIDQFLPIKEYIELLASVDIAIIDEISSMALGNLTYLIYFKKKIFLNSKGVLKRAFDKEKLPYLTTDKLSGMSYSEFLMPVDYSTDFVSDMSLKTYQRSVQTWKDMIAWLDKK